MSEVLEVAKALSRSTDQELERIIGIRLMPSGNFKDFFDFATALLKPQNLKGAVAGLTSKQILAFSNLIDGSSEATDQASLEVLAKLYLVQKKNSDYIPLESASTIFKALTNKKLISAIKDQSQVSSGFAQEPGVVDPLAGIGAFETVQALTELVLELEQRYVPEVGRGGVGLAELKRLASFLGREVDYARKIYALAQMANLVVLHQKRWRVGSSYQEWINAETQDRWLHLASSWLKIIGPESAADLAEEINLDKAISRNFPLATDGITSHVTNAISLAELIGLTAASRPASWFKPLMRGELTKAKKLIGLELPKVVNQLVVQADLTLTSTGPLDTETELKIRRFADIERIGVASSYRMSALSLSYGMESGLTAEQIKETLTRLSGRALPQAVEYLINETKTRFGRLVVKEKGSGALICAKEPILLTAIMNHSELKVLGLERKDDFCLATRFDQEIVYYQLREAKFTAIAVDSQDKPIVSFRKTTDLAKTSSLSHSIQADIKRWREHDRRMGENPVGDDILRSLELAIKNKAVIHVTVKDKKLKREFKLLPTSLANGRLRAKDKQADCERVLPITSIVSVGLDI
ncbi:MAG: hypothetical protein RIQ88_704 [Actinomycetota bacterium]